MPTLAALTPQWFSRLRYRVGDAITRLRWHSFKSAPHRRYDRCLVQVSDGFGVGIAVVLWDDRCPQFQIINGDRLMAPPIWWRPLSAPPR